MKITDLIKQLNELKELHGDVEVVGYNPEYANYDTIVHIHPVYPIPSLKKDENAPAWSVCVSTF